MFKIEVAALAGSVFALEHLLRDNTVGGQGCADRLETIAERAKQLAELAQNGDIEFTQQE